MEVDATAAARARTSGRAGPAAGPARPVRPAAGTRRAARSRPGWSRRTRRSTRPAGPAGRRGRPGTPRSMAAAMSSGPASASTFSATTSTAASSTARRCGRDQLADQQPGPPLQPQPVAARHLVRLGLVGDARASAPSGVRSAGSGRLRDLGAHRRASACQVLGSTASSLRYSGSPASSSTCVPTARDPALVQHRHPVGQLHGGRPVRDHQRGHPAQHPPQRGLHLLSRCGRPMRTAGRPAPAPAAGRARPGPAPAAAAGRRRATGPARRSGCPGPTAARRRSRPRWRSAAPPRSARRARRASPSATFSRTLAEISTGSSNARAHRAAQLGQPQLAHVDPVQQHRAAR